MSNKKISIIVPIYNIQQYLDKCISSIIAQSYKNLEIILVDDGSTDNSGKICDRFAAYDNRIKVIHKDNGGLVSARKEGIKAAEGEYIGFVDGDDYIEREMYEMLAHYIEEMQVDFIHSGYFKNDGQKFSVKTKKKYILNNRKSRENIIKKMILDPTDSEAVSSSIWSKLFKKEFLGSAYMGMQDKLSYGEDLWCICSCIMRCDSFGTVPEAWYHYMKRETSICNERNLDNIQRETELYKSLGKLFEDYELYRALKAELEHFYLRNLLICMRQLTNTVCPVYQYPIIDELAGKKILLYGMGEVGQDYYTQLRRDMRCTLMAVSDRCAEKYKCDFMKVIEADEITVCDCDVIVVAVLREETARMIADELAAKGIGREKIVWRQPKLVV
ncbi:glycosyltransferase [Acetatifactor muris]|uniref:glycosyltransferase n=1 Tax=Acetatifactor muris TaxID=879566 RepID=UPI001FA8BFBE|nr:glycosyltransferase [Acetatifactor muris]MCR2045724.1 glycosyltransferase [Acetatifactor muris]